MMTRTFEDVCKDALVKIKKGIESLKKIREYLENPTKMTEVAFVSLDYDEVKIDSAIFEYDEENFEWILHAYPKRPISSEVFEIIQKLRLFPGQYEVNIAGEENIQMLMATILVPKENYRTFLTIAKIRYLSRLRKVFARLSDPTIQKKLLQLKKQLEEAEKRKDRKTIERTEMLIESLLLE